MVCFNDRRKILPTYNHRKNALKFFILSSITLKNKFKQIQKLREVLYMYIDELIPHWQLRDTELGCCTHCWSSLDLRTNDPTVMMAVWRVCVVSPRTPNFSYHRDIPLNSARWYRMAWLTLSRYRRRIII